MQGSSWSTDNDSFQRGVLDPSVLPPGEELELNIQLKLVVTQAEMLDHSRVEVVQRLTEVAQREGAMLATVRRLRT